MPQSRVLQWPRVSAHSVLVKIACTNKLCTQKGNPADLLNVVIRSHSSSVIIHQCREDDRQKLHQFKRRRKKALSLISYCTKPILSVAVTCSLLIFFTGNQSSCFCCFQDYYQSECCLIYCCCPVLRYLRICLYLLVSFKAATNVNFHVLSSIIRINSQDDWDQMARKCNNIQKKKKLSKISYYRLKTIGLKM